MLFIFDMGGVVAGNVSTLPGISERLGITPEEFMRFCGVPTGIPPAQGFDHGLLAMIQSGLIDSQGFWEDFRANVAALAPLHPQRKMIGKTTQEENLWETCFHPEVIPGTGEIIEALKNQGYRVVCGTNTLDAHYAIHRRRGDYRAFHAVYPSHLLHVIKPQVGFWERILEIEGVEPRNAVFIDDLASNVEGARRAGLEACVFTTSEALMDTLSTWLCTEMV